ncbi:MAG: HDOD domain-containing protein [Spirochaetes bacterium]|nr:HDOD domain-containing protein [Spirochaetota bacterium]
MHEHIKQRLDQIISNLTQLPSLPDIVSRIINMVNDPNVDFNLVASEISKDQAITANILKLCNSAYFSKGKEIASLDRAIVTLGLKEVKDMIVVATTKQVLDKTIMGYDLAKGELWKHNLAVAMLSKQIALDKKKKAAADIVFTGGIIHDVGKTVLALFVANTFKDILNYTIENQVSFNEAEREIMGYNHQEIGKKVLQKWKFPEVLQDVVEFHHTPSLAPEVNREVVSIVHVANAICLMAGVGIGGDGLYQELSQYAIEKTGLTESEIEKYYSNVPELLNQMKNIM